MIASSPACPCPPPINSPSLVPLYAGVFAPLSTHGPRRKQRRRPLRNRLASARSIPQQPVGKRRRSHAACGQRGGPRRRICRKRRKQPADCGRISGKRACHSMADKENAWRCRGRDSNPDHEERRRWRGRPAQLWASHNAIPFADALPISTQRPLLASGFTE